MGLFDDDKVSSENYLWAEEYKHALQDSFWTDRKFTFQSDVKDFWAFSCPEQEREMIVRTLAAIAQVEIKVKRFWADLGTTIRNKRVGDLGLVIANTEVIHNDAYERLLRELGLTECIDGVLDFKAVRNRSNYLAKYNEKLYENDRKQFIYSIVLFTLFTENVSLFSQFYILLWLNREKGILKDTAQQVKYTRNEETLHAKVGAAIIRELRREYPGYFDEELRDRIYDEAREAYKAECAMIDSILGDYEESDLNKETLKAFVRYKIDEGLAMIRFRPIFQKEEGYDANQFMWIEEGVYSNPKVDFFHSEPTSYIMTVTNEDDF